MQFYISAVSTQASESAVDSPLEEVEPPTQVPG